MKSANGYLIGSQWIFFKFYRSAMTKTDKGTEKIQSPLEGGIAVALFRSIKKMSQ